MEQATQWAMNLLGFAGGWWLSPLALRQGGLSERVLASFLITVCWLTLGLQLLGSAAALAVGPLAIWNLVLFAAGAFVRWGGGRGVAGGTRAGLGPSPAHSPPARLRPETFLALALTLWTAAILAAQSYFLPVKVVSDGPIYHLYFAIRWWKEGKLFLVPAPFGENAATYFPANGDLWFTWLLLSWGDDRFARIGQAPFLLMAALAASSLARTLGASRNASTLATLGFITSTPLFLFSFEANVDTIFVAGYLTATLFLVRCWLSEAGDGALLLAGLAAGFALGTKPVAIVFIPPLILLAWIGRWRRYRGFWDAVRSAAVLLGGIFAVSGFWYLRTLALTGNPLYPLQLKVFGTTILSGWYGPEAMRLSPYFIPVGDWKALVDILLAVVDPRLAPLWCLALAGFWFVGSRGGETCREDRGVWILAAFALANIGLYWLCIPYRTQQRFMLHAVGLAAVPLARLIDRGRAISVVAGLLIALHLVTPHPWPFATAEREIPWDQSPMIPNAIAPMLPLSGVARRLVEGGPPVLLSGAGFLAAGALSAWCVLAWRRAESMAADQNLKRVVVCGVPFVLLGLAAAVHVGAPWLTPRDAFYPAFPDFRAGWLELEARSGTSGVRVAYAGTNIPYYLFGCGLRNQVRYVNVDRHRDWLLHHYHQEATRQGRPNWPNPRPGWDRAEPDYTAWLANLSAAGIQLLVVTRVNPAEGAHNVADADGFPIERVWADLHPEHFEPLYGRREHDPWFRLYRLRSPGATLVPDGSA